MYMELACLLFQILRFHYVAVYVNTELSCHSPLDLSMKHSPHIAHINKLTLRALQNIIAWYK